MVANDNGSNHSNCCNSNNMMMIMIFYLVFPAIACEQDDWQSSLRQCQCECMERLFAGGATLHLGSVSGSLWGQREMRKRLRRHWQYFGYSWRTGNKKILINIILVILLLLFSWKIYLLSLKECVLLSIILNLLVRFYLFSWL